MENVEVAAALEEVAFLLELQGVPFKPRAYQRAARAIETLGEPVTAVWDRHALDSIPGVGASIAEKIDELLRTGHLQYLDELRRQFPAELHELASLPGVGPKTILRLYWELGVKSLPELEAAARAHRIQALRGFGSRAEEKLLAAVEFAKQGQGRQLLRAAQQVAAEMVRRLGALEGVQRVEAAGSLRRGLETVGDVDLLVAVHQGTPVAAFFTGQPEVQEVLAAGDVKASVRLRGGLQVDLRVVAVEEWGAALLYFTGSKVHNIALRGLAQQQGWKLNEYGLFAGEERLAGASEEEVYRRLGLTYVPPELREGQGELAAAREGGLPDLVDPPQMRGDLQMHTTWSDGTASIAEMAVAAAQRGYEYILVTDHTAGLRIAGGLDETRLRQQHQEIEQLNRRGEGPRILHGVEANIQADGRVDVPRSILEHIDLVVASIHTRFSDDRSTMTRRLTTAMEDEAVSMIGHPTGRLLLQRPGYEFEVDAVFQKAADTGTVLEINAQPNRLDLGPPLIRRARELGCTFSIGTDAHSPGELEFMPLGVTTARRGWLRATDVVNTLPLPELLRQLKHR